MSSYETATSDEAGTAEALALREVAVQVAVEAAHLAQRVRGQAVAEVDTKSSETDVVTAGDTAAERLIRERLAQLRPGEPVLGEEGGGGEVSAGGLRWVVDPIDGTVNYLYGLPWYAVSVAAERDGVVLAGAVVEPASGRVWRAARGHGADQDGTALRTSAAVRLDLALIATGFGYRPGRRERQAALVAGLAGRVRDIRRVGSAALDLCAVAAGWVDGYLEHGLRRWDWAAAGLIAEEAGATVRFPDPSGVDPDGLGADAILAAAPGVADELCALLRELGAGQV